MHIQLIPAVVDRFDWAPIEAIATMVAVLVAAYQIALARRESRLRATFEHLRELESRLSAMGRVNPKQAQKEVLAAYRGEVRGLTDAAQAYLALLNALEFMSLAIATGTVDRKLGKEQIGAACRDHVVDLKYLKEFQTASRDHLAYRQLEQILRALAGAESKHVVPSGKQPPPVPAIAGASGAPPATRRFDAASDVSDDGPANGPEH